MLQSMFNLFSLGGKEYLRTTLFGTTCDVSHTLTLEIVQVREERTEYGIFFSDISNQFIAAMYAVTDSLGQ